MAKTVDKGTGLSLRQKQFLGVVLEEPFILKNFYLSGGTALSCWYLHHRESYDLDLFTQGKFNSDQITNWLKAQQDKIGFRWMGVDEGWHFQTYFFRFSDNSRLKVDFGHYTDLRLQKGIVWKGLEIDSLRDIAVNKAHLFTAAPRERDYVDLYFILKETRWRLQDLLADSRQKFGTSFSIIQIVKNLFKVEEITSLPKMLVPFDQKAMEKFYTDLAKSLKDQIFA